MSSFFHIYIKRRKEVSLNEIQKQMNLAIDWFRISEEIWIVFTTSDAKKWFTRLNKYVKDGGELLILKLDHKDRQGWITKKFWDWIKKVEKEHLA